MNKNFISNISYMLRNYQSLIRTIRNHFLVKVSYKVQLCLNFSIPYSAAIILKLQGTKVELLNGRSAKFAYNRTIVKRNNASSITV